MKRLTGLLMVFILLAAGLPALGFGTGWAASAASPAPKIVDIQYGAMLLEDGTLWFEGQNKPYDLNLASIDYNGFTGYGITRTGGLVKWLNKDRPQQVPGASNVKQLTQQLYLDTGGSIHSIEDQTVIDNTEQAVLVDANYGEAAYITTAGWIKYQNPNNDFKNLAQVPDVSLLSKMAYSGDGDVATLDQAGRAVIYSLKHFATFDSSMTPIPEVLTDKAADLGFTQDGTLLVVLNDGTVWTAGNYDSRKSDYKKERYKLGQALPGLNNAVKISPLAFADNFYFEQKDGSWASYNKGKVEQAEVPSASELTFALSEVDVNVGDRITAEVTEALTNGTENKLPLDQVQFTIQKPYLLKSLGDGSFKAAGVGVTDITASAEGIDVTLTVWISSNTTLTGGKLINGTVYLPLKSVMGALGGTITYVSSSKTFAVQFGSNKILLIPGYKAAKVNGKNIDMGAPIITDQGTTLFPAKLLTQSVGASLKWDAKFQIMKVSFDTASLTIESVQTKTLKKNAALGNLTKVIGKTYWVNHFGNLQRFSKITIADINLNGSGGAAVITVKTASGQKFDVNVYEVSSVFSGEQYLFTSDPKKRYNWSSSVWKAIQEEHVLIGMTKEQVHLSWGDPQNTDRISSSSITVETWGYSGFRYVTFTNGKVTQIYANNQFYYE